MNPCVFLPGFFVVNNTLSGNRAPVGGGVYVITFSNLPPLLRNNILWGDTASTGAEIWLEASTGSQAQVDYCDIQGGWNGATNLNADPLFVDAANGDYHLRYDSPCRDFGSNVLVAAVATDFEGDPRIADGTADIGADEFSAHLYEIGAASPGGTLTVRLVGKPGLGALWAAGNCVQSPPLSIPGLVGVLHLCSTGLVAIPLGVVPSTGWLDFSVAIPISTPLVDVPTQAVIGLELSNLSVISIR